MSLNDIELRKRQLKLQEKIGAVHVFGEHRQWAISEDDHCLRFHPQWSIAPEKMAHHIWFEAWDEVQRRGGFEAMLNLIREKQRHDH